MDTAENCSLGFARPCEESALGGSIIAVYLLYFPAAPFPSLKINGCSIHLGVRAFAEKPFHYLAKRRGSAPAEENPDTHLHGFNTTCARPLEITP